MDGKNTAGSYSALVVLETGAPFAGAFYMLPQYRAALDVRQGARPPAPRAPHLAALCAA